MEEELFFEINESGRYIRLIPSRFLYGGGEFDEDLLDVSIQAKSGGLLADINGVFMWQDFKHLYVQLQKLSENLNHSFEFENLESDLNLNVKGDGVGNINITVSVYENFTHDSKLIFTLCPDQSFLNDFVKQLYKIVKALGSID